MSYHDVYVTTPHIPRRRLFDCPYTIEIRCTRTEGWTVWNIPHGNTVAGILLGGEYAGPDRWLLLDVEGAILCDSRPEELKR